jgi:hypothetical protein
MSLDLNKLANKLDKALSNETSETLNKFLTDKRMSNNKQSSSIEWYIIERHNIEIQSRLGKISSTQYDEKLIKIEEQAKAMHKEEIIRARLSLDRSNMSDFPKALNNATDYYNETFGGNNEQR